MVKLMQPATAGGPEPVEPVRGRGRKIVLFGLLALMATVTALVVTFVVFVAPAAGAAGGCGGGLTGTVAIGPGTLVAGPSLSGPPPGPGRAAAAGTAGAPSGTGAGTRP
ncbi:hypothetical protein [Dactylosporangium sp. NPDC005555]|uniref:hypothetical protein n=1 Tax=Dactylosporangium sp. NPDC005555 TaxID=3154889 RepID=UPI0033A68476